MKRLTNTLEQQNKGKALTTALNSKHKCSWLWTQRGLTPGNKMCFIQALSGTLPRQIKLEVFQTCY